jgi:hypothetical protein
MTVNTESSRAGSASSINRSEKEPILQIEKGIAGTRAMLASRRNSYHFQPSIPRLNDCLSVCTLANAPSILFAFPLILQWAQFPAPKKRLTNQSID